MLKIGKTTIMKDVVYQVVKKGALKLAEYVLFANCVAPTHDMAIKITMIKPNTILARAALMQRIGLSFFASPKNNKEIKR